MHLSHQDSEQVDLEHKIYRVIFLGTEQEGEGKTADPTPSAKTAVEVGHTSSSISPAVVARL